MKIRPGLRFNFGIEVKMGTLPERLLIRELRKFKIYFSTHQKSIIGTPDIVFRRKKLAVFVDSDFWHGNPGKFVMPKSNVMYWKNKIKMNKVRDQKVNRGLRNAGWLVIRFWESKINKSSQSCAQKVIQTLIKRGV